MTTRSIGVLCAGVCAVTMLSSCGTVQKVDVSEQQIEVDRAVPVAFDIENFHGSVRIVVDATRTDVKPVIKKHVSWWAEGEKSDAQDAVSVRSRTTRGDGMSVVQIKTSTNYPEPEKVWVDLTLFVPRCDGVRVWNRGGKVTLEGVAGAIQVENGSFGKDTAPIEVRTDKDITDPVVLSTDAGSVAYQVGPGSSGRFTLDSSDSTEEFNCQVAWPGQVYSDGRTTTATLNGGTNPVMLSSGKGSVIVLVMQDPMAYTNTLR